MKVCRQPMFLMELWTFIIVVVVVVVIRVLYTYIIIKQEQIYTGWAMKK
jgi:hypothetical protein